MTTCTKTLVAVACAALMAALPVGAAIGSPLAYVNVEGRIAGTSTWYGMSQDAAHQALAVQPGQAIDLRVTIDIANVGTVNKAGGTTTTITRLYKGTGTKTDPLGQMYSDGLNSAKFNIAQSATDPVQANLAYDFGFGPESILGFPTGSGWDAGTGPSAGAISSRGNGLYNLTGVRPIRANGNFGTIVTALNLHAASVAFDTMTWGATIALQVAQSQQDSHVSANTTGITDSPYGSVRVNGTSNTVLGTVVFAYPNPAEPDPVFSFRDLVLYTPWASAEAGPAYSATPSQDLTLAGGAGFSSHTALASAVWDIGGQPFQGLTPSIPWAVLAGLGTGTHEISLHVTTADGGSGTDTSTIFVPEPATLTLLGLGVLGLVARRRRS